jgi:glycosyltransferase involved in cell wall biosynthesis
MRIAMVGPFGFHPNKTMRSRALQLARPLVQRGHSVKLFMPPWQTPEESGREWQEDGVDILYTALNGGVVGTAARLTRQTLAWKPEVVHAFKPKAYSGLTAWWLWTFQRSRIRLVTDLDDWEGRGGWNDRAPYTPLQKRFFDRQENWGIGHCHRLTVASRTLQSLAWSRGIKPERVVYLPNGPGVGDDDGQAKATRAELGLAERPVILLYSRLFEFETGRLVEILRRVQAELPDLAILAVGLSLYEEEARIFDRQISAARLQDAFVDLGWVDEARLPHILASADVGIYLMEDDLLNRAKCPVKLADMLYAGLPVVAENVGQAPEYVLHRRTGLLRQHGDTAGVAADLVELLKNEVERQRLAEGARKHIRSNFTWEHLAETAERAYDPAISQG